MNSIDQSLSIYIPRVTRKITAKFITENIETMGIGSVERVDLVETADGRQMTAYVHFSKWNETKENAQLQQRIKDPKQQARLVYDAPWYWILLVNHNPEPEPAAEDPMDVVEEPMVQTTPVTRISTNPVSAQKTFADVLRGITVRVQTMSLRDAPPLATPRDKQIPAKDIEELTQMVTECDEEWNAGEQKMAARRQEMAARQQEMARDQGIDTDEEYTQRLNQQLQVIIGDLQARLAWCEQMCVNTAFRTEVSNDAISSLTAAQFHANNYIGDLDARMRGVEYELWPDDQHNGVSGMDM
jgi:hypothetical protein